MTEERSTLEDITNRVEKFPEAVQHETDLELQIHWFRLHLEKGNKKNNDYHIAASSQKWCCGSAPTKRSRKMRLASYAEASKKVSTEMMS